MFALADCNNFFASCECVFRPDLEGRPVIVLSSNDGCAVARSNEAKALGVKMGVPLFQIRDLVRQHDIAVFSSNFALYGDMSARVQAVLREFAPVVEQYSIDEAFLDLRGLEDRDLADYARQISRRCRRCTGIPVSVGVAPTKTLAKVAAKLCKRYPRLEGGCWMYRREDIEKVLRSFPAEDIWGIGRRSQRKLESLKVKTAWDFASLPETCIRKNFALPGLRTWKELHGEACIALEDMVEPKQTICVSRSFEKEISDLSTLSEQIALFAGTATEKLRRQHSLVLEMAVFAWTNRFREDLPQTHDSHYVVFPDATADYRKIISAAVDATRQMFHPGYGYKKGGVLFTRLLQEADHTPSLFEDPHQTLRGESLSASLDRINRSIGPGSVRFGAQGDGAVRTAREHQSPHYTTRWTDIPRITVK